MKGLIMINLVLEYKNKTKTIKLKEYITYRLSDINKAATSLIKEYGDYANAEALRKIRLSYTKFKQSKSYNTKQLV